MIRDYWELLDKEVKARIFFGLAMVAIVLVIVIPYFIAVLNHRNSDVSMEVPETEEISETKEEEKVEEKTETPSEEPAETENTDTTTNETTYAYSYAKSSSTQTTSSQQKTSQAASSAPTETVTRTTVDDNSAGDGGYTPSGIDDPGADEDTGSDGGSDETENSEV